MIKPAILFILAFFLASFLNHLYSSIYGVPPGFTGAPFDGMTCATISCHDGPVTTVSGWITTDIPASGYQPADTYNVTLTAIRPATSIFGFQMTTQGLMGTTGSFLISDPLETQYSQNTGYITHKIDGTSGKNEKTWEAKWIAPNDTFETEVTLYAAVVGGVFILDDEVFLTENRLTSAYVSVNNATTETELISYPNPFNDYLNLVLPKKPAREITATIFNSSGELVLRQRTLAGSDKTIVIQTNRLSSGVYFLEVRSGENLFRKKILKL